ncbi:MULTISPECIES: hypothetical protein [unclassified Geodermatophilus]
MAVIVLLLLAWALVTAACARWYARALTAADEASRPLAPGPDGDRCTP